MPIVNYIREHRRFIQYASDEKLTANERLLWYALMEIFNQRADGHDWPDDFIRISNDRVLTLCPMGFDTMAKARNGLKQRGLIEFRAGNKNKENPQYMMHYFCPEHPDHSGFYPKLSDNMTDNTQDNMTDNTGGNTQDNNGDKVRDIYPNNTWNNKYIYRVEDEEPVKINARVADSFTSMIRIFFRQSFGKDATNAEASMVLEAAARLGFSLEMIREAVRVAAENGAATPAKYTLAVLQKWWNNDVMMPGQIPDFQFYDDVLNGRSEYGTGDPAEDARRAEAAHRERIRENEHNGIVCKSSRLKVAEG